MKEYLRAIANSLEASVESCKTDAERLAQWFNHMSLRDRVIYNCISIEDEFTLEELKENFL